MHHHHSGGRASGHHPITDGDSGAMSAATVLPPPPKLAPSSDRRRSAVGNTSCDLTAAYGRSCALPSSPFGELTRDHTHGIGRAALHLTAVVPIAVAPHPIHRQRGCPREIRSLRRAFPPPHWDQHPSLSPCSFHHPPREPPGHGEMCLSRIRQRPSSVARARTATPFTAALGASLSLHLLLEATKPVRHRPPETAPEHSPDLRFGQRHAQLPLAAVDRRRRFLPTTPIPLADGDPHLHHAAVGPSPSSSPISLYPGPRFRAFTHSLPVPFPIPRQTHVQRLRIFPLSPYAELPYHAVASAHQPPLHLHRLVPSDH